MSVSPDLYEQVFRTPYYFDPFAPELLARWRLQPGVGYQPLVAND
jgi:hypothetical protein